MTLNKGIVVVKYVLPSSTPQRIVAVRSATVPMAYPAALHIISGACLEREEHSVSLTNVNELQNRQIHHITELQ